MVCEESKERRYESSGERVFDELIAGRSVLVCSGSAAVCHLAT